MDFGADSVINPNQDREEQLLQGVGNEVLIAFATILAILAGLIALSRYLQLFTFPVDDIVQRAPNHNYENDTCPICLGPHQLPVETNCGHKFCGQCIRGYLNNRAPREYLLMSGILICPLCRQNINLLLLRYNPSDGGVDLGESQEVETAVREYNIRYGTGPQSWLTYIRDCPVLVRHMLAGFFSFGGLVWMFRLRVIVCFAVAVMYLLSPLDIIPEAIFGIFGLLDDVFIMFLCAIYISIIYRRFLLSRSNDSD